MKTCKIHVNDPMGTFWQTLCNFDTIEVKDTNILFYNNNKIVANITITTIFKIEETV